MLYENIAISSCSSHEPRFVNILRYSARTWWERSIDPLLSGLNAEVRNYVIANFFATALIKALIKFAPWSVRMPRGDPNRQIKFFMKASAVSIAEVERRGAATEYFVRRSWIVKIYEYPDGVVGRGPIMSMDILSKACPGVSVSVMG